MGMTPTMTFMLLIVQTLDDDTDMCQSRMYFLIAAISFAWFARLPIGANAAMPLLSNAAYEEMVGGNQDYLLGMFDLLKGGFIPSIALTIYCILAWRLIPRTKISPEAVGAYRDPNAQIGYSKRTDIIVTLVLITVMVGMALNRQIGSFSYIIVSTCVLVLIFTNVLSLKEAVSALTCDTCLYSHRSQCGTCRRHEPQSGSPGHITFSFPGTWLPYCKQHSFRSICSMSPQPA